MTSCKVNGEEVGVARTSKILAVLLLLTMEQELERLVCLHHSIFRISRTESWHRKISPTYLLEELKAEQP